MADSPITRRPRHQAVSTPDNRLREDFAHTFHRSTGIPTGNRWSAKHRALVPMKPAEDLK